MTRRGAAGYVRPGSVLARVPRAAGKAARLPSTRAMLRVTQQVARRAAVRPMGARAFATDEHSPPVTVHGIPGKVSAREVSRAMGAEIYGRGDLWRASVGRARPSLEARTLQLA